MERIILVVGSGAQEVRDYFASDEDAGAPIEFVEQKERLGTGHAVRCVRDALGELKGPIVVMYGDMPLVRPKTIRSLVNETKAKHNACTASKIGRASCRERV